MAGGRKILWVFGAGASVALGACAPVRGGGTVRIPIQADFWPTVLRFCSSTPDRKAIESFLFRYFKGYQRAPARLDARARREALAGVDVEEVFTFLSERVHAPSTSPALRTYLQDIWDLLVRQVARTFVRFQPNGVTRRRVRKFLKQHVRSRDTLVSFNYDTVFEGSIPGSRKWQYDGIEAGGGLRILKPHGSINWGVREGAIVRTDDPSEAVVVAPTHLKFVDHAKGAGSAGYLNQHDGIKAIWTRMEAEMLSSRCLVFVGYSFPVADLYFSSVLRTVLLERHQGTPQVILVNPDAVAIANRLRARFPISSMTNFFRFEDFINLKRGDLA